MVQKQVSKAGIILTTLFALSIGTASFAAENASGKSVGQKVENGYEKSKEVISETYSDAKNGTKKAYRSVKDKTCEMINGKMECASQKVSNKVKNVGDEVKDTAEDL